MLVQDPNINDAQMKEFRIQLVQVLESSEAKAKQTRRRIVIAFVVYLTGTFGYFFYLSHWGDATTDVKVMHLRELILIPFIFLSLVAVVIGVLLVVLYLFKYGPRLSRARFDLQTSLMLELQQQMKQLGDKMARRDK